MPDLPPEVAATLRPAKKKPRGRPFAPKEEGDDPRRNRNGRPPGPPPPPGFRTGVVHLADEAMKVIHNNLYSSNEHVSQRAAEWVGNTNLKLLLAKLGADATGLPAAVDLTLATDEELVELGTIRETLHGLLTRISARKGPPTGGSPNGAGAPGGGARPPVQTGAA